MCITYFSFAQEVPVLEKSHEISRKSKKGYLAQIVPHADKNTFDMIFVLKGGGKTTIKTEIYTFDKDLNLIDTQKDEQEIERVKTKFKWFKFNGDDRKFNMTSANANLKNELIFRKKEITQYFNWWWGDYRNVVQLLEKVKATDAEGNRYSFRGGHYDNYQTGEMLLLAPLRESFDKNGFTNYDVISVNGVLKINKMDGLKFAGGQWPIYSKPLLDEDSETSSNEDEPRDWIVVFAPVDGKNQGMKPTDYTYVRMTPEGKIKEKVAFQAPTNGWRILGVMEKNGVATIVGSGIEDKPSKNFINDTYKMGLVSMVTMNEEQQEASTGKSGLMGALVGKEGASMLSKFGSAETMIPTQELIDNSYNDKKYDHFVVGQIVGGQYKTLSYPTIDDFENAHQKPSNQKKYFDFDGKKFVIDNIGQNSDGSVMVTGQDFDTDSKSTSGKKFKEAYLFKFTTDGKLAANYGVEIDQKHTSGFMSGKGPKSDYYPVSNFTVESVDKSKTYWFMNKVKTIRVDTDADFSTNLLTGVSATVLTTSYTPLKSIQYGSIDNKSNTMGVVKDLGEDEKRDFYLFRKHNRSKLNQYQLFFSETIRGDKILISRFDLTK
jgi:hypothetical protein